MPPSDSKHDGTRGIEGPTRCTLAPLALHHDAACIGAFFLVKDGLVRGSLVTNGLMRGTDDAQVPPSFPPDLRLV
ncbi:MAG: hypothetical protein A3F84_16365 [Candidatus Handelsmanbacteria bacterium RIFCSPLOWO2_12_FULL_64_10]|uniref:Uncharacterized protein n=1 Tax=Handelsmanbacteria sp. (strain RIFCSPLOWO2_12_FULL_64_10) TaxID=1817868 RepID=A0A1F6CWJ0_HANXR|nr:MAG: hypothetical protein A3F84_16365 [Candidatus Handelsmanbacteria bacterium RIFCSPLOWO2_12_FULL_64_10]